MIRGQEIMEEFLCSIRSDRQYMDFVFNGWGMKFPAGKDNQITRNLFHEGIFADRIQPANMAPFVLEGGSIESDGQGTLMTTAECLLSLNRNDTCSGKK